VEAQHPLDGGANGRPSGKQLTQELCGPGIGPLSSGVIPEHWPRQASYTQRMDELERVLILRYALDGGEPQTLQEVATELGITRERVRELEEQALRETPTGAELRRRTNRSERRIAYILETNDPPPICPRCGVTMVPATLSADDTAEGDWLCLECEERDEHE